MTRLSVRGVPIKLPEITSARQSNNVYTPCRVRRLMAVAQCIKFAFWRSLNIIGDVAR